MSFARRFTWLDFIKKFEYASIEECENLQKSLLLNMLDYSIKNVPYYREIALLENINPSLDNVFEDIKKFPILTKKILRCRFAELKSEHFWGSFFRKTSGGSTGEPAVFLQHGSFQQRNAATELLLNEWAGRKPGESMVRLWGDEGYVKKAGEGLRGWVKEHIMNVAILNSYRMSAGRMRDYIKIINRKRPMVIEGYVESLYELAKFAKRNNLEVYSPRGVISTAGTLYPEIKEFFEREFNCIIINKYGSREAGDMAWSCGRNEVLHQNIFNHYIEILDDNFNQCAPGQTGGIYVTTLHNRVMPLIRYKIGDVAVPAAEKKCSCGRGMPLLGGVRGRETEHFLSENGELIYAGYFRKLLYGLTWIIHYQVVQEDYGHIVYYIVKDASAVVKNGDLKLIESGVSKIMGSGCRVDFEFVDSIQPSRSGKFLYTLNKVRNNKKGCLSQKQ